MIVHTEPGPFVQWIEDYPLPEGGLPKGIEMYDGKEDPDNHLKHFNGMIRMQRWNVPIACHMFALTLKDLARVWLDAQPEGSITSFEDLKTKFRSHFSQQRKYKKMHLEAHNIKRRENESIRQYITRYTDETTLMKGLSENQKISGFVHGLRFQPLVEFLSTDLPREYTVLMDKTYTFLVGKETAGGVTNPAYGKEMDRSRRNRHSRHERFRTTPFNRQQGGPSGGQHSFQHPRNTRDILATEKAPSKGNLRGKDMTKFCEFHNRYGHETNECKVFKGKVEEAVKSGKYSMLLKGIKELVQRNNHGKNPVIEAPEAKVEPLEELIATVIPEHPTPEQRVPRSEAWKKVSINFPPVGDEEASDAPIIIGAIVGNHPIKRVHLDTGSGCEIMYEHCFLKLNAILRKKRKDNISPLVGFSNERTWSLGEITLDVTIGNAPRTRSEALTFVIVRAESPYNIILGRPAMKKLGMVPSPIHAIVKFPTPKGIGFVKMEPRQEVQCSQISIPEVGECSKNNENLEVEIEKLFINKEHPDQHVMIGRKLPTEYKRRLKEILEKNKDVFAWTPTDMTGIPRKLMINGESFDTQHCLNTRPHLEPIKQKRRSLAPDRSKAVKLQVEDLVKAGILREVKYQSWVANLVMVRKHDGGWRMCVDFTDINKACPKDCYPLPEIDWKIESLVGFRLKCFLDAYKGYHQIQMHPDDEDKTAFYTSEGIFCYKKMPFGLKNAGATYQKLVDKAFGGQIGRNLETYVDDMVIKSRAEDDMLLDIEETFRTLRSINMKLNPKKCSFGVEEGQFLGHVITKEGFRADPEKVKDVQNMKPPQALKEVQSLNGKLAALHRFLSKSADKSLPFFHTLKGCLEKQNFRWTKEAQKAFIELKNYLCRLPTMTAPFPGETLQVYLAASGDTISAVLLVNRKGVQQPIYYVSRILQAPETRYPEIEKLALALIHAARRLRRYFQAYPIQVLTDKPIKQVLTRPEVSGRLAKWAVELGEHEIEFKPRNAIKGQILADFLAEVPVNETKKRKVIQVKPEEPEDLKAWKLFTDGASSADGSGAGLILTSPEGKEFTYALRFDFKASNNAAEYEALLAGLRIGKQMKVDHIHVCVDSQIVAFQVDGTYEAKEPAMKKYLEKVRQVRQSFKTFRIQNVSRSRNKIADALSKLASTSFAHLTKEVLVEVLQKSSIEEDTVVSPVEEEGQTWMTPIIEYLTSGLLPEDKGEARKIRIKAPQYILRDEGLYKKSYMGPLLRCVGPKQAKAVIQEVHHGCYGAHAGARMVVAKITKMGYYWPSMHGDTLKEIQACDSCQIHATVPKAPKHELIPVTSA
uniref:uncharacterized protein LOC122610749 n=1 Tax=Erigeron canadensis TaxID=72917 RepID=UPI001CB9C88E|nr:uncharacterized protein LOC122610749 [Erigeron canadensis]